MSLKKPILPRDTRKVTTGRSPSYWNPQLPNPLRKKNAMAKSSGSEKCQQVAIAASGSTPNISGQEMNQQPATSGSTPNISGQEINQQPAASGSTPNISGQEMNYPLCLDNGYGYSYNPYNQSLQPQPNQQELMGAGEVASPLAKPRARSMPPRQKLTRPTYSLCGKCRKCKNLIKELPENATMTFPKYSHGTRIMPQDPKLTTSSHLGQSAKNFRAIRFSSHM